MNTELYTIVVAEDEELLLNHLVEKLNKHIEGFKVIGTAQTGTQALKLIEEFMPDVLITDIQMPHMNGIELLEQVHSRFSQVKTVILSGYAEFAYAQKAIQYEVSDYILKPIDPSDLIKVFSKIRSKLQESGPALEFSYDESMLRTSPAEVAHALHDFISIHFAEEFDINAFARQMNYSYSYLTKAFYQEYQQSPTKYLIQVRLNYAKQLLTKHFELSIQQVGEMTGYPDQSYFSRMFKKFTGYSPLEYRNRLNS